MKIKTIKKIGLNKYDIVLETGIKLTTYDDIILKYNLLYKKELDQEFIDLILKETSYYDVYHKVLKYIGMRLRSTLEIRKYIEKYDLTKEREEELLNQLKNTGLLNDQNFVKAFVSDKIHLSTMGPLKIKSELLAHQIEPSMIDEEISNIDQSIIFDKLYKMVQKKIKINRKYSRYVLHQKIITHFRNLGYETAMIDQCFNDIYQDDQQILNQEADKLYKKLSQKYHGTELLKKVKEKLYQKGFNMSEITSYLNEKES